MLSGRVTDKILFVAIYSVIAILVVIQGGRKMTNYVLDAAFYNDYLMPWKIDLIDMRHRTVVWPDYKTQDPVGYMQLLMKNMASAGLTPPKSNAAEDYLYRLNKFGEKTQQILLVGTSELITLYNLPESTFKRIDRFIDGESDADAGHFTGNLSTDGISRIGYWKF